MEPVSFKDIKSIKLNESPAKKYSSNGPETLIDGKHGTLNLYEKWLGFEETDVEAVIDLQKDDTIHQVRVEYMESQKDWIFAPTAVECAVSMDNKTFKRIQTKNLTAIKSHPSAVKELVLDFSPTIVRYVQITIRNQGICPDWHKGAGGKAWLFVDEITID